MHCHIITVLRTHVLVSGLECKGDCIGQDSSQLLFSSCMDGVSWEDLLKSRKEREEDSLKTKESHSAPSGLPALVRRPAPTMYITDAVANTRTAHLPISPGTLITHLSSDIYLM